MDSDGAKRLRRSRWERGTRERVAREGVRPLAGAGGYIHEDRDTMPRDCAKGNREGIAGLSLVVQARRSRTRDARPGPSRKCEGCGQRTGRRDVTGRAAARRAGSFNPEELGNVLSGPGRFRSYGPPLREERIRSFRTRVGPARAGQKRRRTLRPGPPPRRTPVRPPGCRQCAGQRPSAHRWAGRTCPPAGPGKNRFKNV